MHPNGFPSGYGNQVQGCFSIFFQHVCMCVFLDSSLYLRVLENNSTHCVASTVQVHHGKFVIPLYLMSLREKEACVE